MKKKICLMVSLLVLAGQVAHSAGKSGQTAQAGEAVPAVVTVGSEIKRVVLIRLKYNTDMLDGIEQSVKNEKIKNAVILSGVGSVTSYHVHAVSNTTLPAKLAYTQRAVPMDHREWQALRGDLRLPREHRLDAHLLPAEYLVLAAQRAAVHLNGAGGDPLRKDRSRVLRQGTGEGLIEAQSCRLLGQHQCVRAELPRACRSRRCGIRYTRRTHAARRQREALSRCG